LGKVLALSSIDPISVIIPLHNKRDQVTGCLHSVLSQSFNQFEIVVVDDGSTDGSVDVVEQLADPRIRLIRQKNQGVSVARNRGIAEARHGLCAFLDSDDLWEPEFLSAIVALRREYPSAGLLATGVARCWTDGRPDLILRARSTTPNGTVLIEDYFAALREGEFICSSNVAIPRHILNEVGGFPPGVRMGEDRHVWGCVSLLYPAACDSRVLASYFTPPPRHDKWSAVKLPLLPSDAVGVLNAMQSGPRPARHPDSARQYIDWTLLLRVDNLFWRRQSQELSEFLAAAPFQTEAARRAAALLTRTLRLLPFELVRRLVWRRIRHNWKIGPGQEGPVVADRPLLSRSLEACRHANHRLVESLKS